MPFLDSIYPVRETVESNLAPPDMQVQRYFKNGKEGRGPVGEDEILFDWEVGTATHTRDGESREPIEVPEGVQDPISSFYAYRASEVVDYGPVVLDVTDGKKVTAGEVRVVGRERIRVPAGTFDAVIVEPEIEGVGGHKVIGGRVENDGHGQRVAKPGRRLKRRRTADDENGAFLQV